MVRFLLGRGTAGEEAFCRQPVPQGRFKAALGASGVVVVKLLVIIHTQVEMWHRRVSWRPGAVPFDVQFRISLRSWQRENVVFWQEPDIQVDRCCCFLSSPGPFLDLVSSLP